MEDKNVIIIGVGLIILTLIVGIIAISSVHRFTAKKDNEACQRLGYEEFKKSGYRGQGFDFCKDSDGNYHYVEMTFPKGFFSFEVDVIEVSVGDVRVTRGT